MKVAFVHLSDIHMDNDWEYNDFVSKIVNQLAMHETESYYFLVTGDLAFSGKKEEYDKVDLFFKAIKIKLSEIGKKCCDFVFVPGNHDINYNDGETRQRSVLVEMSKEDYLKKLVDEEHKFENFLKFSEKYGMPHNFSNVISGSFPSYKVNIGKFIYNFILFNNAVYTAYKDANNDSSQGSIFFHPKLFDSIIKGQNTVNLLLMHYPIYYFDDETRELLGEKMQYLSYVLTGHIHKNEKLSQLSHNYNCPISSSAAIHNETLSRIGFSIIEIDDETRSAYYYNYFLNNDIFVKENEKPIVSKLRVASGINPLTKKEDYIEKILHANYETISLLDYFVFPELKEKEEGQKNLRIGNFEVLQKEVSKKGVAIINGYSQSGKTSLLSYLFFQYDNYGIPVILDLCNKNFLLNSNIEATIKGALEEQYDDNYTWNIFISTPKNNRIALVDNMLLDNAIKDQLDLLKNYFGKIIITAKETTYSANNMSAVAHDSILKEETVSLNIEPMFEKKRLELIEKRLGARRGGKQQYDDISLISQKVQSVFDKCINGDLRFPYFVNKIIDSVIDGSINYGDSPKIMYTKVYENFVSNTVSSFFDQDEYMVVSTFLELLAYSIIKSDKLSLQYSELLNILNTYLSDKRIAIDQTQLLSRLINNRILFSNNDIIGFCSQEFLSFYAAKYFSQLINNDFESFQKDIDIFLDQCHLEVVSRFITFVSGMSNKKVSLYLIDKAEEFASNYREFNVFESEFAQRDQEFKSLKRLTRKEKEDVRIKRDKKESELYDKSEEIYANEVNNGKENLDDDLKKAFYKGIGLMEIVSSMLPDIKASFDFKDQKRCIEIIYKMPFIVFFLENHSLLTSSFDSLRSSLKEAFYDAGKDVSESFAESVLVNYLRASLLGIIDYVIEKSHTKLTEKDLGDKLFCINDHRKIVRLISLMYDSNPEQTFEKVSYDYFKNYNYNVFARNCISLIVRKYISWHVPESKLYRKKDYAKVFFKNDDIINETIKDKLVN